MQQFSSTIAPLLSPDRTIEIVLDAINEIVSYELAVILSLEAENMLRVRSAKGPMNTPRLKD